MGQFIQNLIGFIIAMMVVTNKNKNSKLQQHVHQVEFYAVPPPQPAAMKSGVPVR